MKKVLLLLFMLTNVLLANAQLAVNQWGQVRVGPDCDSIYNGIWYYENQRDTLSSLWVSGNGSNGNPARIILGSASLGASRYVDIGERYSTDYDLNQLHLHGLNGIYYTRGYNADENIFYFNPSLNTSFVFERNIQANVVLVSRDERLKKNIAPIDNPIGFLSQLNGVSYTLKSKQELNSERGVTSSSDTGFVSDNDRQMAQAAADLEDLNAITNHRYGFLAQEVKQVFPELVNEDAEGYLSVDYIGLIPVMVNAINQLNGEVDDLRAENAKLMSQLGSENVEQIDVGVEPSNLTSTVRLYQNTPNPFSNSTTIKCMLPSTVSSAQIMIFDLQGKFVKTIEITDRGLASVTIEGYELQAGMYVYALIVDGEEVATKRMILTK